MKDIMKKETTEGTQEKKPSVVIAKKLKRVRETIDRNGNVIKTEVFE